MNTEAAPAYGALLVVAGQHAEAIAVLTPLPESLPTLFSLAKAHQGLGDARRSVECARRAVALAPNNAEARMLLDEVIYALGQQGGAIAQAPLDQGALPPGLELLRDGDFAGFKVFADYCAPMRERPGGLYLPTLGRNVPRWDGRPVGRLVVILDLGQGDCLQFARWLPEARARCGHLTVATYPGLCGLFPDYDVVAVGAMDRELVRADAYISAMMLPAAVPLGYKPAGGYLSAEAVALPPGFTAGICWAGNPRNPGDAARSATPADLESLRTTGATLYSLMQRDEGRPDWILPPPAPLTDFAATARIIAALDLVISVDSAVAHLAGALGRPVWIALAEPACWRWERHPTRSNWYRSATLFRQERPGDFRGVFARMAATLNDMASERLGCIRG